MTGKLRGVKTLREKADALVAAELAACLFRKRRKVQRIRVSPQVFHLLGTEPAPIKVVNNNNQVSVTIQPGRAFFRLFLP